MMPARGPAPIEQVSEKHGANLALRLRAEYLPGPPPFPDSPEETEWVARRESLVVTVLRGPGGWSAVTSWTVGGAERTAREELPAGGLEAWVEDLAARGAWTLPTFAPLAAGEGTVEVEQEAYEYHDHDPDSLDLDSWRPPRRHRIERSRAGALDAAGRALLESWARFLPAELRARSPLAAAFTR